MGMNGPSWGRRYGEVKSAKDKAATARREADRLFVHAWNVQASQLRERGEPSPTLAQVINGGYRFLLVKCRTCKTSAAVDVGDIRRPRDTDLTTLSRRLKCRDCGRFSGEVPRVMFERIPSDAD